MKNARKSWTVKSQTGASLMETLLSIAIIAAILPFAYYQLAQTSRDIMDIAVARKIVDYRIPMLNFVRLHQDDWDAGQQIKLEKEDIDWINEEMGAGVTDRAVPYVGFIDKYMIRDTVNIDIYLAFELQDKDETQIAKVARAIGDDAGTVMPDKTAYGIRSNWGAASQDFIPGDLVYRVSINMDGAGFEKYLHKVESDQGLNRMMRDMNMSGHDIFDIGNAVAKTAEISDAYVQLASAESVLASEVFFQAGATLDPVNTEIRMLRVTGDVIGFKNIHAATLSGGGGQWSSQGAIISDRATIGNSVNVGKTLYLKSDSSASISGFSVVTGAFRLCAVLFQRLI